jgi:predicted transcriptional regulator of viral defense system
MKFVLIKVADSRLGSTSIFRGPDGVPAIYSSKPRALFDAIYDWSRFGGIPRAYEWIRKAIMDDPTILKELIAVVLKFGNQGTIRRIGYLLENLGIEPKLLRPLRKALRNSKGLIPYVPTMPMRGKISKDWGIIANGKTD